MMAPLRLDQEALRARLILEEGLRLHPYTDTVGKITIGVGRNLTDRGITYEEAMLLLDHDLAMTMTTLQAQLPWVTALDAARQLVLADMSFNLGVAGVERFPVMLAALQRRDFAAAAAAMRHSTWATQVGPRAHRLAQVMETGQL